MHCVSYITQIFSDLAHFCKHNSNMDDCLEHQIDPGCATSSSACRNSLLRRTLIASATFKRTWSAIAVLKVFLFGEAHEHHWRIQAGELLAIFQPKVCLLRSRYDLGLMKQWSNRTSGKLTLYFVACHQCDALWLSQPLGNIMSRTDQRLTYQSFVW